MVSKKKRKSAPVKAAVTPPWFITPPVCVPQDLVLAAQQAFAARNRALQAGQTLTPIEALGVLLLQEVQNQYGIPIVKSR
jgi:hypothetical protein